LLSVEPIGYVVGGRVDPVDDDWDAVTATIRLDAIRYDADALRGLDAFSHLEVLCHFQLVAEDAVHRVRGLDAIDGTPVLDLKPVMQGFLPRGELRQPAWASELMAGYWRS
jgi:tRNA (Thr-GGU) A37 N-methylase